MTLILPARYKDNDKHLTSRSELNDRDFDTSITTVMCIITCWKSYYYAKHVYHVILYQIYIRNYVIRYNTENDTHVLARGNLARLADTCTNTASLKASLPRDEGVESVSGKLRLESFGAENFPRLT